MLDAIVAGAILGWLALAAVVALTTAAAARRPSVVPTEAGWTVYRGREVIGWIRAASAADPYWMLPPGTFWAILREGVSSCTTPYGTPEHAARALARMDRREA